MSIVIRVSRVWCFRNEHMLCKDTHACRCLLNKSVKNCLSCVNSDTQKITQVKEWQTSKVIMHNLGMFSSLLVGFDLESNKKKWERLNNKRQMKAFFVPWSKTRITMHLSFGNEFVSRNEHWKCSLLWICVVCSKNSKRTQSMRTHRVYRMNFIYTKNTVGVRVRERATVGYF